MKYIKHKVNYYTYNNYYKLIMYLKVIKFVLEKKHSPAHIDPSL